MTAVQRVGAHHFAELAEALNATTLDIFAAWSTDGRTVTVLHTTVGASVDSLVLESRLTRGLDGVLRLLEDTVATDLRVGDLSWVAL